MSVVPVWACGYQLLAFILADCWYKIFSTDSYPIFCTLKDDTKIFNARCLPLPLEEFCFYIVKKQEKDLLKYRVVLLIIKPFGALASSYSYQRFSPADYTGTRETI